MREIHLLDTFVPIQIDGPGARAFLQGQLTQDLKKVTPDRAALGALCNGQGRIQAIVTVVEREEGLVVLFDASVLEGALDRLQRSVLSAKVAFARAPLAVAALSVVEASTWVERLPTAPGDCTHAGSATVLRWWGGDERFLLVLPRSLVHVRPDGPVAQALAWRALDVKAGLPQIFGETKNVFVPATLNLDLLNGISYDKGCYVGQEVMARARRGGVTRRMFGFVARCGAPPPGTSVASGEEEVGLVVDAAPAETGCALLAVVDLDRADGPLTLRGALDAELQMVPLPYPVPRQRR